MKRIIYITLISIFLSGCFSESQDIVHKKLEIILQDDLNYIKSEIDSTEVMDSTFYKIILFKHFPNDLNFSYKAVVEFYYLKNIKMKQVRKYRYRILQKKWDRYVKQYQNML